ncbi:MAG: homocysteine S-methyltransferase family protein [Chromatiales bacterium]|jgi:S-methylmethionine-dependent homocysteine/selenocysteine methylase
MQQLLENRQLILMEAAVVERLRRKQGIQLHPQLVNAPLIYSTAGRAALEQVYRGYIDVASHAALPLLLCTPTWRANRERVEQSGLKQSINIDAARFMQQLRDAHDTAGEIHIGGMIGCKNDCYTPEQGLSVGEARDFHAWQIQQLASADVDFLIAVTLPALEEAKGIALAMQHTGLPYFISFVINRDGRLLDGNSLLHAVQSIDDSTDNPPLAYLVNCAYPTFLRAAEQPPELFERLIGLQANASSLDHCELDGAEHLHADELEDWGQAMLQLHRDYGLQLLGGCCGTDDRYLQYLVSH